MTEQVGSLLGTFVTSSDVADAKARLVPSFNQTQADAIANSAKLGQNVFDAWESFYDAWLTFADEDEETLGRFWTAGSRMDRVETYAQQLLDWQKKIQSLDVDLSGPLVLPKHAGDGDELASLLSRVGLVVGVVVAGAFVVREIVLASPRRGRRRRSRRREDWT